MNINYRPALDFAGLITPSEAARRLGISQERVRQLRREGQLEAVATPFGHLFTEVGIERRIATRASKGATFID